MAPPHITNQTVLNALENFKRFIRIKKQFAQNISTSHESDLQVANPLFMPDKASAPLEKYISTVEKRIHIALKRVRYMHMSTPKAISQALESLKNDNSIIIKHADKNLGTCVVSTEWYEKTALDQLNDLTTYEPLNGPPEKSQVYLQLEEILNKHNKLFYTTPPNSQTLLAKYILQLKNEPLRLGQFYLTIKVHKQPPAGRPICSSIGTMTYHCSKYLDKRLQPLMKRGKSYIKDTFELLQLLQNEQFPTSSTIVTADVESLYPSIVTEDGLTALDIALKEVNTDDKVRELYVELTRWVLNNNYLCFGNKVYRQIRGTAMGTPLAVTYANIYLCVLETQVLKKCFTSNPFFRGPYLYKRFIDDVLTIFDNKEDGLEFITEFNNIRPGIIRLTHSISEEEGVFLDTTIFKSENFANNRKLETKLYQKPMNKYVYLHYQSCHSKVLFKSFIQSELKRYRLTCSRNVDFEEAKTALRERLLARSYPSDILDEWMNIHLDRNELFTNRIEKQLQLKTALKSAKTKIPLIFKIDHTNRTSQLKLNKCLKLTEDAIADIDYPQIFQNRQPVICLKRPRNLADILVRAKFSKDNLNSNNH